MCKAQEAQTGQQSFDYTPRRDSSSAGLERIGFAQVIELIKH